MRRISRYRPSPAMVVALMALFLSLGGVSYGLATGSVDSREIKNGTVRGKDIRNRTIRFRDVACPPGTRRYQVGCFEVNVRGTSTWSGASQSCGTLNRRLPTASELDAFRVRGGITLGAPFEMSSNVHFVGGTVFYITLSDAGLFSQTPAGNSAPYRCVTQLRG
jgi:hypothetical protein